MLDHYLNCLESCENASQIDSLVTKAFERLKVEDFSTFVDAAIVKLDFLLVNVTGCINS